MNVDLLERQLVHCAFGHTIYFYSICSSTQDLVHTLALTHRAGSLVLAAEQSASRGRQGRPWWSHRHASITGSFLLKSPLGTPLAPSHTLLAGMAVRDAVAQLVPQLEGRLHLKWPNDVVVHKADGRLAKLAGILVEGHMRATDQGHAVLGIGINVNQQPTALPLTTGSGLPAVSLRSLTGRQHDRASLLVLLCRALEQYLHRDRAEHIRSRTWDTHLITLGARVTVQPGVAGLPPLHGTAVATTAHGTLVIEDAMGQVREVDAADVTLQALA